VLPRSTVNAAARRARGKSVTKAAASPPLRPSSAAGTALAEHERGTRLLTTPEPAAPKENDVVTITNLLVSQTPRYASFYSALVRQLDARRFDVDYRRRRLQEVLAELHGKVDELRVLDFGFGSGSLLLAFPESCSLYGVDVSVSAVHRAEQDERFAAYAGARFQAIPEDQPELLPREEFDVVVTSHLLEHVPDDTRVLEELLARLAPGGTLIVFVPIEEPDYILFHRRNYSLQSIAERVARAGFILRQVEGSMYVNGHIWKLLTIPSRRRWPLFGPVVDALRMLSLGILPYPVLRQLDRALFLLGVGPRQALVVAERPNGSGPAPL
jgi:2-polyprenyl-3-methyl-5-hydroxy-6-metoxy-1,4-benzoquinol methylase